MGKKEEIKAPSVYRPARILNEVDEGLKGLVDKGKYKSYNAALNGELKKRLKVNGRNYPLLKELKPGEKFKFASVRAFRVCVVLEHCKTDKKKKYQTRKCKIIDTGQIIYPSCKKEIIKL